MSDTEIKAIKPPFDPAAYFEAQERHFNQSQKNSRLTGKILLLIGVSVFAGALLLYHFLPVNIVDECVNCTEVFYINASITLSLIVAGIICLILGSGQLNTAASFEKQLLKLNDLRIAAGLLNELSNIPCTNPQARPSEKDKATQQVITGLLNSYTG